MTTIIEILDFLETHSIWLDIQNMPSNKKGIDEASQRLRELEKLVKAVHSAKGRHHSQIAMCDLYEACGLPSQRPNSSAIAVKESA